MSTLLTKDYKPPTSAELKHRQIADEALDACRAILESTVQAYADGELTFESAVNQAASAIDAERIPRDSQREKMLGAFVHHVCSISPISRSRTSSRKKPNWIKKVATELVEIVVEKEDLPKARISRHSVTAYERASEILKMRGLVVSAYDVERYYTSERIRRSKSK